MKMIDSARQKSDLKKLIHLLLSLLLLAGCGTWNTLDAVEPEVDSEELFADLEYLASDELEGRRTGTDGNRLAREYIAERFESLGIEPESDGYFQRFSHIHPATGEVFGDAVNVIGRIKGSKRPERYLVVTAHYDHLGIREGKIYNGADDNASGSAGLLAVARWFSQHPPEHSILLIATDAEEQGLGGAWHFVREPTVPLDRIVMNVNMDMISNNNDNEIYAAGTHHYPFLRPIVESTAGDARIDVLFGFDHDEAPQDWTTASDHGPFHQQGIPFVYFGVEDNEHYHQPTDTYETINREFFRRSILTILTVLVELDRRLEEIEELSGR